MNVTGQDFTHLAVGDGVVRMLAGTVRMDMRVTAVEGSLLTVGAIEPDGSVFDGGWTFDRATGFEVDEDLGSGPDHGFTVSFLVPE